MSFSTWPGYGAGTSEWLLDQPAVDSGSSASSPRLRRALGVLEAKFDNASKVAGYSDTFLRIKLSADAEDDPVLLSRLPLAWAALRARHPSLASVVVDGAAPGLLPVQPREFHYTPPSSLEEAYSRALATVLVEPSEDVEATMDELLHASPGVLNGPRVLLSSDSCLARLMLVLDQREGEPRREHYLTLLISHVISDGLSVIMLVKELFDLFSATALPTPPVTPSFNTFTSFLSSTKSLPPTSPPPVDMMIAWQIVLPFEETLRRLPLASEHHFPAIPVPPTDPSRPAQPATSSDGKSVASSERSQAPSAARRRWLWAMARVILQRRASVFPQTLHLIRLPSSDRNTPITTRWPTLRFDKSTSHQLVGLCKHNSISPSMLLFSILSIALANILAEHHPEAPYTPIVLGFPHSNRPYLDPSSSLATTQDLAIRLNFGCIQLPSLPQAEEKGNRLRWTAVHGARLAKRQFTKRFDAKDRSLYLAGAYFSILHRLLNSTGHNPIPLNEPQTTLNASMIGDLDRILPTAFPHPSAPSKPFLRLSDMLIGTRLHPGEGQLIEAYTYDGMVTMSVGFDDSVFAREQVDELLERVERIGRALVEPE